MAVYQTGSVAGVVALLDTLRAFALAQGATINNYSAEGSGQKLMLKLGSGFFNFRAYVNETQVGTFGAVNTYGIYGIGSTGYNGAATWYQQANAPTLPTPSTQYPAVGICGLGSTGTPSPTLVYHLFYHDRPNQPRTFAINAATNASPIEITVTASAHRLATGDRVSISGVSGNPAANGTWTITKTAANKFTLDGSTGNGAYTSGGTVTVLCEAIYLIVEYPSGIYARLMFGQLDKSETGEVPFGHFITGTNDHTSNTNNVGPIQCFGRAITFGFNSKPTGFGLVYATVDGTTGWKLWPNTNGFPQNANEIAFDTTIKIRNKINNAPNMINSQTCLEPLGVCVTRDGVVNQLTSLTPWTIIGFLPEFYYSNIRNVEPAAQYSIGSTNYRAFPWYQKSDVPLSFSDPKSHHLGFFVRSN